MYEPTVIDELLDRAVRERPEDVAVVSDRVRWTYRQLGDRVARIGAALRGIGVRVGDRVAILDKNSEHYLALYFALPKIGAIAVPLNYRLAPPELEFIVDDASALVLLFSKEYEAAVDQIRGALTKTEHLICLEEPVSWARSLDDVVGDAHGSPSPLDADPERILLQMYTSGTTGRPKGAMLTHKNLVSNTLTAMHERDYTAKDIYLHVAPLYHIADCELFYGMSYAMGGNVVLREFRPEAVLRAIAEERVSVAFLVPAMINALLEHPGLESYDLSSLRLIVYGGSAIPEDRLRAALSRLPCQLSQGYGLTETSPILCVLPTDDHVLQRSDAPERIRRIQSCGRPAWGVEVKVFDENDVECEDEVVGEIVARGDNIMKGYYNRPDATEEAMRGGWFHTGDMAFRDADGYIYIVDRKKDMIVSGGENIYPREVEEVLFKHPAVLDAAVIGVPSEKWGEEVKAVVALRDGKNASGQELIEHCRSQLAHYKAPKSVDLVDTLPRNPSGKVLKRELREGYWKDKGRRVN